MLYKIYCKNAILWPKLKITCRAQFLDSISWQIPWHKESTSPLPFKILLKKRWDMLGCVLIYLDVTVVRNITGSEVWLLSVLNIIEHGNVYRFNPPGPTNSLILNDVDWQLGQDENCIVMCLSVPVRISVVHFRFEMNMVQRWRLQVPYWILGMWQLTSFGKG